jgi:hypothetical protein
MLMKSGKMNCSRECPRLEIGGEVKGQPKCNYLCLSTLEEKIKMVILGVSSSKGLIKDNMEERKSS